MTSTQKMHDLYILLPVHNRYSITQHFIQHLQRQTFQDYHLVLLDDGSTDGTATMVEAAIPNLTIIRGIGDWWWAGALHQGYLWLKKQKFDYNPVILIMNDDTEFDTDFLQNGLSQIKNKSNTLLMAECHQKGNIGKGTKINWQQFKFRPVQNNETPDCFCTSALFLQWQTFEKIGSFYPRLLPHYISDYEFTYRAKRKGFQLLTNPNVIISWDNENTGHHHLNNFIAPTFQQSLQKFFSQKSAHNPVTFSIFIWLACPWYLKLWNWSIVWTKAFVKIFYLLWQTTISNQKSPIVH
ncbi:glycosyltransferase family 2 protein [Picosynechococcus sp. PCC 73109]|uniref:glycosyltransferase family 2 protein n=1 Tax=Picosynechococcus sp. PCC 73109 TaxID=374982 RepID=UPI0018DC019A|nr:glycosyltransferase [Picosynechococcus sp. PCC 73109]